MPDALTQEPPAAPVAQPEPETAETSSNISEGDLALRFLERAKVPLPAEPEPAPVAPPEDLGDGTEQPEAIEAKPEEEAVTENPAPETEEAEPETAEAPAEGEEVLSQPNDPIGVKKRIGKAVAKQREAEARAAAAEAKVKELEAKVAEPAPAPEAPPTPIIVPAEDPDDRTAQAASPDDLVKLRREAEAALEWAELNADGVMDEATGETKYTPAQIRQIKVGAQRHLNRYIPQREAFLKERETGRTQARQLFPQLFDSKSAEHHQLQAALRQRPHLARDPHAELIYGLAMEGLKVIQERVTAAQKPPPAPAAKPKPPPAPTKEAPAKSTVRAPSGNATVKKALDAAEARYSKQGTAEAYQEVLRIRNQLRQSQQ